MTGVPRFKMLAPHVLVPPQVLVLAPDTGGASTWKWGESVGRAIREDRPDWAGTSGGPATAEARQMRVCRASTGGRSGGQGPTRAGTSI
jgi:hypothetical protein